MDQRIRESILTQVRWLTDEVAPRDLHRARALFEGLIALHGIEVVLSVLRGDRPE